MVNTIDYKGIFSEPFIAFPGMDLIKSVGKDVHFISAVDENPVTRYFWKREFCTCDCLQSIFA